MKGTLIALALGAALVPSIVAGPNLKVFLPVPEIIIRPGRGIIVRPQSPPPVVYHPPVYQPPPVVYQPPPVVYHPPPVVYQPEPVYVPQYNGYGRHEGRGRRCEHGHIDHKECGKRDKWRHEERKRHEERQREEWKRDEERKREEWKRQHEARKRYEERQHHERKRHEEKHRRWDD